MTSTPGIETGNRRDAGLTLAELLVVIAVVAILASFAITGFIGTRERYAFLASLGQVRATLRAARDAARREGFEARVEVRPGERLVRGVRRQTLGIWRFEPDGYVGYDASGGTNGDGPPPEFEVTGAFGIAGKVSKGEPIEGRIGGAIDFREPGAHIAIEDRPTLNPGYGVFLEAWVLPGDLAAAATGQNEAPPKPEDLARMRFAIASKGESFFIRATGDYRLEAGITGWANETRTRVVALTRGRPLGVSRWSRVGLVFSGGELRLLVDGIDRAYDLRIDDQKVAPGTPLPGRLVLSEGEPLLVSHPDEDLSFIGTIDEVRLAAFVVDEARLAGTISIVGSDETIFFDAEGKLEPMLHAKPVELVFTDDPTYFGAEGPPPGTTTEIEMGAMDATAVAEAVARLDPRRVQRIKVELSGGIR